jgi:hypothetical protein
MSSANSTSEAVCWCASDSKCPHRIEAKLKDNEGDIERGIDDILRRFDRSTIRKFLKSDLDGNTKTTLTAKLKEVYGKSSVAKHKKTGHVPKVDKADRASSSDAKNPLKDKGAPSLPRPGTAPTGHLRKEKNLTDTPQVVAKGAIASSVQIMGMGEAGMSMTGQMELDGTMREGGKTKGELKRPSSGVPGMSPGMFPHIVAPPSMELTGGLASDYFQSTNNNSSSSPTNSSGKRPRTTGGVNGGGGRVMSQTVGQLSREEQEEKLKNKMFSRTAPSDQISVGTEAWADPTSHDRLEGGASSSLVLGEVPPSGGGEVREVGEVTVGGWTMLPGMDPQENPFSNLPSMTAVSVGLLRIADSMTRKILPWQAAFCPRAVESLRDTRQSGIQDKHDAFIIKMTEQLENKVLSFIEKKDQEVDLWIQNEADKWSAVVQRDDSAQRDLISSEEVRILARSKRLQEGALWREHHSARIVDEKERESARDQLATFRRQCRADTENGSSDKDQKALYASMEAAQARTTAQRSLTMREVTRRHEEAHDWLCCVADNALTAMCAEAAMDQLQEGLQAERQRALDSLHSAINTYTVQHNAILKAIVTFSGKVHQHAADYMKREQLVARAFLQYLTGLVEGAIQPHVSEIKKKNAAWEAKLVLDRSQKKATDVAGRFQSSMSPYDRKVTELKERLLLTLEHVTMKMQSLLNGRDRDIGKRRGDTHRRLTKHVRRACNARRAQVKGASVARKDDLKLEETCIERVNSLQQDIRSAMDQLWIKQHLKERRMYEAAAGRTARMEASAILLWKKHSHLAMNSTEDYEMWLTVYERDRDHFSSNRSIAFSTAVRLWKNAWSRRFCKMIRDREFTDSFLEFVNFSRDYHVSDSHETVYKKMLDKTEWMHARADLLLGDQERNLDDAWNREMENSRLIYDEKRTELFHDWDSNLVRLNNAVSRRIEKLKGMETELEETLRLSFAQAEVEASIFEQMSCAQLEQFWLLWGHRLGDLSRELNHQQQDYKLARRRAREKATANEAKLDLAAAPSNDVADKSPQKLKKFGKEGKAEKEVLAKTAAEAAAKAYEKEVADKDGEETLASQCHRFKRLLDGIRGEILVEFRTRVNKAVGILRKKQGVGRKRAIPGFLLLRVLLASCDVFWEQANMQERIAGQLVSKGQRLYGNNMPRNARAVFCVCASISVVSNLLEMSQSVNTGPKPKDGEPVAPDLVPLGKIDPDQALAVIEKGIKKHFLTALLSITCPQGDFGTTVLEAEAYWTCASVGITPPRGLMGRGTNNLYPDPDGYPQHMAGRADGKLGFADGLDDNVEKSTEPTASKPVRYADPDPVDLINSLLSLSEFAPEKEEEKVTREGVLAVEEVVQSTSQLNDGSAHENLIGKGEKIDLRTPLLDETSIDDFKERASEALPSIDLAVLMSILGRHDDMVDTSEFRVSQAAYFWRRTAMSVIICSTYSPGPEYPRLHDLIEEHVVARAARKNVGHAQVQSLSPFEVYSQTLNWITSMRGVPLSVLNSLCLQAKGGSCDPWLEDPVQSARGGRIEKMVTELVGVLNAADIDERPVMDIGLPHDLAERLKRFDLGGDGRGDIPMEVLRTYLVRDDPDLSHAQVTAAFWCICRSKLTTLATNTEAEAARMAVEAVGAGGGSVVGVGEAGFKDGESGSFIKQAVLPSDSSVAGSQNPLDHALVNDFMSDGMSKLTPTWEGVTSDYVVDFGHHLNKFIRSVSSVDAATVLGVIPDELSNSDAQTLVFDAMKLDTSARNQIPSSCCIWLGQKSVPIQSSINVARTPNAAEMSRAVEWTGSPLETARMGIELQMLGVYPVLCERQLSDQYFQEQDIDLSPDQIAKAVNDGPTLTEKRVSRMGHLTDAWSSMMMDEWAQSLYGSRQARYESRAAVVKQCLSVYYSQYDSLYNTIIKERTDLMTHYDRLKAILNDRQKTEEEFMTYQFGFFKRFISGLRDTTKDFIDTTGKQVMEVQMHTSVIRRASVRRMTQAGQDLLEAMERSCQGLINGFSVHVADVHYEKLRLQEERWLNNFYAVNGNIMETKEQFMDNKARMDKEVIGLVGDKISEDREANKYLLEILNTETQNILDLLASKRTAGEAKRHAADGDWRSCMQEYLEEVMKLRRAARAEPHLESYCFEQSVPILGQGREACIKVVTDAKKEATNLLFTMEGPRGIHKAKIDGMVRDARYNWKSTRDLLTPLAENYEAEFTKELQRLKARCLEIINLYEDTECQYLRDLRDSERLAILQSFRRHFTTFDLHEEVVFNAFNKEVNGTLDDFYHKWGPVITPSNAKFVRKTDKVPAKALQAIRDDFFGSAMDAAAAGGGDWDEMQHQRAECMDFTYQTLGNLLPCTQSMPAVYKAEYDDQLDEIEASRLKSDDDITRPQVAAVLDVLVSGIVIEQKLVLGYEVVVDNTIDKVVTVRSELEEFAERYQGEKAASAAAFAKALLERIHKRGNEMATLMEAAMAHLQADHTRLTADITVCKKDHETWELYTLEEVVAAWDEADVEYMKPVWPTPPATPRDSVAIEIERREMISAKAAEMMMAMDEERAKDAGTNIVDIVALGEGWMQCLTEKGKVFFFNIDTSESRWERPASLALPSQSEGDFQMAGVDVEVASKIWETPRDVDSDDEAAAAGGGGGPKKATHTIGTDTSQPIMPEQQAKEIVTKVMHHTRLVALGSIKGALANMAKISDRVMLQQGLEQQQYMTAIAMGGDVKDLETHILPATGPPGGANTGLIGGEFSKSFRSGVADQLFQEDPDLAFGGRVPPGEQIDMDSLEYLNDADLEVYLDGADGGEAKVGELLTDEEWEEKLEKLRSMDARAAQETKVIHDRVSREAAIAHLERENARLEEQINAATMAEMVTAGYDAVREDSLENSYEIESSAGLNSITEDFARGRPDGSNPGPLADQLMQFGLGDGSSVGATSGGGSSAQLLGDKRDVLAYKAKREKQLTRMASQRAVSEIFSEALTGALSRGGLADGLTRDQLDKLIHFMPTDMDGDSMAYDLPVSTVGDPQIAGGGWGSVEAALRDRELKDAAQETALAEQAANQMVKDRQMRAEQDNVKRRLLRAEADAEMRYEEEQAANNPLTAHERAEDKIARELAASEGGADNAVDFIAGLYRGQGAAAERMLGEIKEKREADRLSGLEEKLRQEAVAAAAAEAEAAELEAMIKQKEAEEQERMNVAVKKKEREMAAEAAILKKKMDRLEAEAAVEREKEEERQRRQKEADAKRRAEEEAAKVKWLPAHGLSEEEKLDVLEANKEDVNELANYFHAVCGIGRTESKRAAIETVCYKVYAPKKLAKFVNRGQLDLISHLGFEGDDAEDVEAALQGKGDTSMGNMMGGSFQGGMSGGMMSGGYNSFTATQASVDMFGGTEGAEQLEDYPAEGEYEEAAYAEGEGEGYAEGGYEGGEGEGYAEGGESAGAADNYDYTEGTDWTLSWDEDYKANFYYNNATGESTWDEPDDVRLIREYYEGTAPAAAAQGVHPEQPLHATHAPELNYGDSVNEGSYGYDDGQVQEASYQDYSYAESGEQPDVYPPGFGPLVGPYRKFTYERDDPLFDRPAKRREWNSEPSSSVTEYSNKESTKRRDALLKLMERWQETVDKTKKALTDQRKYFIVTREELFAKATEKVDDRLSTFVENTKYLQRVLKKELTDLSAAEKDLRRLFDDPNADMLLAEKLSYVLEALDKIKQTAAARYEVAQGMIDACPEEWTQVEAELGRVGDVFDTAVANTLEQVKMSCDHYITLFAYDLSKEIEEMRAFEMDSLRSSLSRTIRYKELQDNEGKPEEDVVLALIVGQIEMEDALGSEYRSLAEKTKGQAFDFQNYATDFDTQQRASMQEAGSWFDEHRDTMRKHAAALDITLERVKEKVEAGYQNLHSRIASLDYDAEQAAEEELATMDVHDEGSVETSANLLNPDLFNTA